MSYQNYFIGWPLLCVYTTCSSTTTTYYDPRRSHNYAPHMPYRYKGFRGHEAITNFFGITTAEAEHLFSGRSYSRGARYDVVRRLRAFERQHRTRINAEAFKRLIKLILSLDRSAHFTMTTNQYCAVGHATRDPWFQEQGLSF